MRTTNNLDLPKPIVDAVSVRRDRGTAEFTVTELLSPPHQLRLLRKHDDEIVEDAADRIFALLGQAVHAILERGSGALDGWLNPGDSCSAIKEKRLEMPIGGRVVSGALDHFALASGKLSDYKTASVWSVVFDHPEWEQQLNCYAHLLRHHGYNVRELEIVAILRDWSKREARRDSSYPHSQVVMIKYEPWSAEKAQAFMEERVRLHTAEIPPLCSSEERWEKKGKVAVKKPGVERAVRLFNTKAEAEAFRAADPKMRGTVLEERPGEFPRCESYCAAAFVCEFGRSLKEKETP